MKNHLILLLCISILFCIGCNDIKTAQQFTPKETRELNNPISYDISEIVFDPTEMTYLNDVIALLDRASKNPIKIINKEGVLISKHGLMGRGKGEFLQITSMDWFKDKDTLKLGIYDNMGKKYVELSHTDNLFNMILYPEKKFFKVGRLSNGNYIGGTYLDSTAFYLLNKNGGIIDMNSTFST